MNPALRTSAAHVFVESIDEQAESARVHVTYHPVSLPDIPVLVNQQFPRIPPEEREGIIVGKRGLRTASDGPTRQLLESVARLLETDEARGRPGHTESRLRALGEILQAVGNVARATEIVTHTPPGVDRLRRET